MVKFIELKNCGKECLDLMFNHTKIEVSNDLSELSMLSNQWKSIQWKRWSKKTKICTKCLVVLS